MNTAAVAVRLVVLFPMCTSVVHAQSSGGAGGQNPRMGVSPEEQYEGTWVTTKMKKLDGTTRCRVKRLAEDRWQGRFWGVWQQVPFDYTVEFTTADGAKDRPVTADVGIAQSGENRVQGTATIDGAHYDWVGKLTPAAFDIRFTGSRYHGHLELKRVADDTSKR